MSDPEFSLQFKMLVKGRDPARSARRLIWPLILALILVGLFEGVPRFIWGLLVHHLGQ
jgi:hypothetical protein